MNPETALNDALRFGQFLARAIPAITRWWDERKTLKLEEQLDALDVHLARDFDAARSAIAAKHAARAAVSGQEAPKQVLHGFLNGFRGSDRTITRPAVVEGAPLSAAGLRGRLGSEVAAPAAPEQAVSAQEQPAMAGAAAGGTDTAAPAPAAKAKAKKGSPA